MFLALRELKHSKTRYMLISLIMVLIAWLVLFVSGLAKGLSSDNASSIQNMNADYLVVDQNSDHRLNRSVITEDMLTQVGRAAEKSGGLEAAPLGVQMSSVTQAGSPKKIDATFFAIEADGMLAPEITEGRMIGDTAADEVVADSSFKDEHGLKLGDVIEDQISDRSFKIVGFTDGQSFSHAPVLHMNFTGWKTITADSRPTVAEGAVDGDADSAGVAFNAIALKAAGSAAKSIGDQVDGIEVVTKAEALKGIPGYKEEQGSLLMMIAFLFIIAAFVLAVFFYVITIQKMNQFGVLKAIGAKTGFLARSLLFQVLSLSIFSLAIGIALTYGVSFILPDSMPFELNLKLVGGSSLLFLAVAVIGSLLSLLRVAKVDAMEAIGRAA
ncbi:ABC transporter permease [Fontibacillus sp. BL9]|uniref:ABC transporter permease n=1 Tax=Fontibacillus sp. BL9 TaxID=3389971 RepID=UPI00397DA82E